VFRLLTFLVLGDLSGTSDETGSSGGDETDLGSGRRVSAASRGISDMLMVSSSEGMLDGVHGNTTHLRPAVALHLVLVVRTTSLEKRLIDTSTTGNDADCGTASAVENLLGSRGQFDSSFAGIEVVRDNDARVARRLRQATSVAIFHLDSTAGSSFGHLSEWDDISNVKSGLLATVDGLTGGGTLGRDEELLGLAEFVRVLEGDFGEGSSSARVVDNVLHDAFDESVTFGKVH